MGLEQEVGRLAGLLESQTQKLDKILDLVPTVAKHEEKHADLEKNYLPKIEEHEKKINRAYGAAAVLALVGSGIFKGLELLSGWWTSGGGH